MFSSGGGGIKRVQRGTIADKECNKTDASFNDNEYVLVKLKTPINPEKSFLLIQNYEAVDGSNNKFNCIGRIHSSTQLALYSNYKDRDGYNFVTNVFWEVIEFN